jgi:hypothetical protein
MHQSWLDRLLIAEFEGLLNGLTKNLPRSMTIASCLPMRHPHVVATLQTEGGNMDAKWVNEEEWV